MEAINIILKRMPNSDIRYENGEILVYPDDKTGHFSCQLVNDINFELFYCNACLLTDREYDKHSNVPHTLYHIISDGHKIGTINLFKNQ